MVRHMFVVVFSMIASFHVIIAAAAAFELSVCCCMALFDVSFLADACVLLHVLLSVLSLSLFSLLLLLLQLLHLPVFSFPTPPREG